MCHLIRIRKITLGPQYQLKFTERLLSNLSLTNRQLRATCSIMYDHYRQHNRYSFLRQIEPANNITLKNTYHHSLKIVICGTILFDGYDG